MRSANNDYVAKAICDQRGSPENESAHKNIAQLRIGLNKFLYFASIHFDDFARLPSTGAQKTPTPGQHRDIAVESSGIIDGDKLLPRACISNKFDRTGKNDDKG